MPKGFFHGSVLTQSKAPPSQVPRCGSCGLYKSCQSPKMVPTGKGQRKILIVGEAPGCVLGDTRIEVAFRDKIKQPIGIPIKELVGKTNFYVYSFDCKTEKLVLGRVKRVWKTGRKKVYRVTYQWRDYEHNVLTNSIVVTSNHLFLLKKPIAHDPFGGNTRGGYLSIENGLSVGHSLQPFFRGNYLYCLVGTSYKTVVREARFLLECKLGRKLTRNEECHHKDENKWNDKKSNLELMLTTDHSRHHTTKRNPMKTKKGIKNHQKAMKSVEYRQKMSRSMRAYMDQPGVLEKRIRQIRSQAKNTSKTLKEKYKNPHFYYNYLLGRLKAIPRLDESWVKEKFRDRFPGQEFPPVDNHRIISIEYVGVENVYDMEVEKYHNFAANGIFVHNSTEDIQGRQFVGESGQLLRKTLKEFGIDPDVDCTFTNALICRPPGNKTPTADQVDYCRPNLVKTLKEMEPEIIVPLGAIGVKAVIGSIWKEDVGTMTRWAGWQIPCQRLNAWICPTYHPSYVKRAKNDTLPEMYFRKHLEAMTELHGRPFKELPNYRDMIEIVRDDVRAAKIIRGMIKRGGPVAFDYECNSLKPDWEASRLVTCSVCWRGKRTIAFPWRGQVVAAIRDLVRSPLPKIASNLKMEDRWTRRILGTEIRNWKWDTTIGAHLIDNRQDITGLKFQSFVLLGAESYDDHIKQFLRSEKGEKINAILEEVDLDDLLYYNGLDSLLDYQVAEKQCEQLGRSLW